MFGGYLIFSFLDLAISRYYLDFYISGRKFTLPEYLNCAFVLSSIQRYASLFISYICVGICTMWVIPCDMCACCKPCRHAGLDALAVPAIGSRRGKYAPAVSFCQLAAMPVITASRDIQTHF